MKEKQFDHIDHKAREAAENYTPGFDEENWERMESLLDKEKDRRRPFAIWWIPIIILLTLATATGYFYFQPESNKVANKENSGKKLIEKTNSIKHVVSGGEQKDKNSDQSITATLGNKINSEGGDTADKQQASPNTKMDGAEKKQINVTEHPPTVDKNTAGKSNKKKIENQSGTHVSLATKVENSGTGDSGHPNEKTISQSNRPVTVTLNEEEVAFPEKNIAAVISSASAINVDNDATDTTAPIKKVAKTVQSKFYLLIAGGLETSGTTPLPKNGKLNFRYGAGIGYQLSPRFAIQSGFYVSRKKYSAGPDDYHPKPGSYWAQVTINNIDANCLIYEIPLSLNYEFPHTQTLSFVIGTGLTSYILKSERYDYDYTRNGNAYTYESGYTGNSSLFAVLDFSAGINKKLSKAFTLTTNSNLSVPLKGVGDGSVKLYSLGLQVGIKFQPMFKKNK